MMKNMRSILLLVMLAALAAPFGSRGAEPGVDHDGLPSTGSDTACLKAWRTHVLISVLAQARR